MSARAAWWLLVCSVAIGCGSDEHSAATDDEHAEGEEGDEHGGGEEGEHASEVTLSAAAIDRSGVTVGPVRREVVGGGLVAPAELELDPALTAHVSPLSPGRVVSVAVQIGDRVVPGQELAVIASAEVGEARAGMSEVGARVAAARAAVERQQQLQAAGIGTERALIEAQTALRSAQAEASGISRRIGVYGARGRGANIVLTAPIAGVVVDRHATIGEITAPESPTFVISDPSRMWVQANVPEMDIADVRVGAAATLRLAAYPGRSWRTTVDFVAPALDERTRTLPVRGQLANEDGMLRAGLFGRLYVASGSSEADVLAVPETAIARIEGQDVVFVPADEERTFRPQPISTGRSADGLVEVVSGLEESQTVVLTGAFTLKSELQSSELAEHEH